MGRPSTVELARSQGPTAAKPPAYTRQAAEGAGIPSDNHSEADAGNQGAQLRVDHRCRLLFGNFLKRRVKPWFLWRSYAFDTGW
jgi:hypothetical protein